MKEIPIRTKIFLAGTGILFGAVCAVTLYLLYFFYGAPQTYTSLSELRSEMVKSDERDVHADQSVSLRSIILPHPSDEIIYELRPGLTTKFQGVPVRTNRWGMRGPEVEQKKGQNTCRIALLGDSFAFGWGVVEEETFARVFEKQLNTQRDKKASVELLNFGVPGYSTFQEVAAFLEKGFSFDVDIVVIYFVENDFGLPFFIDSQDEGGGLVSALSFAKRAWSGTDVATTKRHDELKGLVDANRALLKLDTVMKELGKKVYIVLNPGANSRGTLNKLWSVRKSSTLHLVDIREKISREISERGLQPQELMLKGDPHPSALKHAMIGHYMAEAFYNDL